MTDVAEPALSEDDLVELSLLRDFEVDQLIAAGFVSKDERQSSPLDAELVIKYPELSLHVTAGPCYPAASVAWRVDDYELSRKAITELRARLRQIADAADATNRARWRNREQECALGAFEPVQVVLALARETARYLAEWREKAAPSVPSFVPFETKQATSVATTMTTSDMAYELLQSTPQEICTRIPSEYRILHVEEVLRTDLVAKFQRRRGKMRQQLLSQASIHALRDCVPPQLQGSSRKEDLVDHLLTPHVTFHGTPRQRAPSVVRHGFLMPGATDPGTGKAHEVRCSSAFGAGIYSSPNADFALCYTDQTCHATQPHEFFGIKLFVCATVLGRVCDEKTAARSSHDPSQPYPGYDAHVANRGLEYVVFHAAQILPVYVVHIDWRQDNAAHFANLPADPEQYTPPTRAKTHPKLLRHVKWPGDIARERAAVYAKASKWFPYGYGPATGGRFVVEDVAEPDDDEEAYGDYQAFRGEAVQGQSSVDFWSWTRAGESEDASRELGSIEDPDGEYGRERLAF